MEKNDFKMFRINFRFRKIKGEIITIKLSKKK